MSIRRRQPAAVRPHQSGVRLPAAAVILLSGLLLPVIAAAQGLTGTLIGTVKDEQGGALSGARVQLTSPALIGGPVALLTNDKGQLRFLSLAPGLYQLAVEHQGFMPYREDDLRIGAGATLERTAVLKLQGVAESVVVQGPGSRLDARNPGFETRFGSDDRREIPTRRSSMFDLIRAAPGVSPTSPSSGTVTTVSAFGSGTNENQFLFDGTNFTCPCNGVARAEPGIDFIQEVQVQSVGASAEYGNVQGAVINVITRHGSDRFQADAAHYLQTAGLTSRPVTLPYAGPAGQGTSGYERSRFRDVTANLGGPLLRHRLWFFAGYQYLRDHDSQPGTDPAYPRTYDQNKLFAKLTWQLTPRLRLEQSAHHEFGLNPDRPTLATRFEAIPRRHISVPAFTFGHLTHTLSSNSVWDVRVGRFVYSQDDGGPFGAVTIGEPVRPDHRSHQRRAGAPGFGDDQPHHHQGDIQPVPHRPRRRRSSVEGWRSGRTGRTPDARRRPDRRQVRRQQRRALSIHRDRSISHRRRIDHRVGVRERRAHDRRSADHQPRRAVRPQPRDQPGPAAPSTRKAMPPARSCPGRARCTPGTSSRRAWA